MICIYCRKDSSKAEGQEHVIPACLGYKIKLDQGVVCDKCNSYFKRLDNQLIANPRIAEAMMLSGGKRKSGKRMTGTQNGMMKIEDAGNRKRVFKVKFVNPSCIHFTRYGQSANLLIDGPLPKKFNPARFVRSLHRIALNLVAWKSGHENALTKQFDAVRKYVREPGTGKECRSFGIYKKPWADEDGFRTTEHNGGILANVRVRGLIYAVVLTGDNDEAVRILNEYAGDGTALNVLRTLGDFCEWLVPQRDPETDKETKGEGEEMDVKIQPIGYEITLTTKDPEDK